MLTDVSISPKSANGKTGPMPTISRPIEATCPTTCAFLPRQLGGNGHCYANGRINGSAGVNAKDMTVSQAVARLAPATRPKARAANRHGLIRDRVVGDLIERGTQRDSTTERVDMAYLLDVAEVGRQVGLTPYGYTHAFDLMSAEDVITVKDSGYVLNASCDSVESLERAVALGMLTTYAGDDVNDGDVIAGRRIITCPEQTGRVASCADCGLCAKDRAVTVRFLMH